MSATHQQPRVANSHAETQRPNTMAPTRRASETALSLVTVANGELFVDTPDVAALFARRHHDITRKLLDLVQSGAIDQRGMTLISWTDSYGRTQPAYRLSERDALVLMPFLGGKKAAEGQARLVDEFMAMRKALRGQSSIQWKQARSAAAGEQRALTDVLVAVRERDGKPTEMRHFANEAGLLNYALTGKSKPAIDRASLSAQELQILAEVERLEQRLLILGKPHIERKTACRALALQRMAQTAGLLEAA